LAETHWNKLGAYLKETQILGSIQNTLYWDQNTGMPKKGASWRSEQLTYIAKVLHKRNSSEEFLNLIQYAKNELLDIEFVLIQRSLMYSMFDLLFETPSYRSVYVISDSEMKELKKNQHQEELDEITKQKVRLEDAFKAQLKHLEEREKEVKKELKLLSASKDK